MENEFCKRRTIIASKNKMSVNKLIAEIILYHISELDKVNNVNNVATILNDLDFLKKEVESLQKKSNWSNAIIKQIFINSGFAKNRNEKEDSVFNEFIKSKYKEKYMTDYDS